MAIHCELDLQSIVAKFILLHKKAQKKTPYSHFKDRESKYKIAVQYSRKSLNSQATIPVLVCAKDWPFQCPGNRWNTTFAAENKHGRNSGWKKGKKNLALCLFITPICAAEDCACSHPGDCTEPWPDGQIPYKRLRKDVEMDLFSQSGSSNWQYSLCRKVILHLGALLCSKDGKIHEMPGMNASLDLAGMLNLNLIREEKRLGFNSSSEFITAVNRRETGKQYIMLLQHFRLQAPKFQHF